VTRLLIIHHDKSIRSRLELLAEARYEIEAATDVVDGIHRMARQKPDLIVVGHDSGKQEGARLLRYMRDNTLKIPVVVVISPGAGTAQPLLMKLGARALVEYPVDQERFDDTLSAALAAQRALAAGPPPISAEELNANLSMLETKLNRAMKCFAGRGQVYLQSKILGGGTSKPRISLKCSLRAEYGLNRDVYYEFIRDVCCSAPNRCEAVRLFNAARESA